MSFSVPAYSHSDHRELLELIPALTGREAGSTLDRAHWQNTIVYLLLNCVTMSWNVGKSTVFKGSVSSTNHPTNLFSSSHLMGFAFAPLPKSIFCRLAVGGTSCKRRWCCFLLHFLHKFYCAVLLVQMFSFFLNLDVEFLEVDKILLPPAQRAQRTLTLSSWVETNSNKWLYFQLETAYLSPVSISGPPASRVVRTDDITPRNIGWKKFYNGKGHKL